MDFYKMNIVPHLFRVMEAQGIKTKETVLHGVYIQTRDRSLLYNIFAMHETMLMGRSPLREMQDENGDIV